MKIKDKISFYYQNWFVGLNYKKVG